MKDSLEMVKSHVEQEGALAINSELRISLQDAFGNASRAEIGELWDTISSTVDKRKKFTFIALSCLAYDEAMEILRYTSINDAMQRHVESNNDEIEAGYARLRSLDDVITKALNEREAELKARESRCLDIAQGFASHRKEVAGLKRDAERREKDYISLKKDYETLLSNTQEVIRVKDALSVLREALK